MIDRALRRSSQRADKQDLPDQGSEATPPPPTKKAPAKAARKAPAKKAPAKKAPAKKAAPAPDAPAAAPPAGTNGSGPLADGPKQAAAQAKSTIEQADDRLSRPALVAAPETGRSPLPLAVAVAISLLAILLVRRLRRDDSDEA